MKLRSFSSNWGQIELVALAVVAVFIFKAYQSPSEILYDEGIPSKNSLNEYKDTLVKLSQVNTFTSSPYKKKDIGTPIQLAGTTTWIVPLGSWSLHLSAKSAQGSIIDNVNPFENIPYRAISTTLKGPFNGVICYDQVTGKYNWVLPTEKLDSIVYVRSKSHHFLQMESSKSIVRLNNILDDSILSYHSTGEILSWCVLPTSDSFFIVESKGSNMVSQELAISELLIQGR